MTYQSPSIEAQGAAMAMTGRAHPPDAAAPGFPPLLRVEGLVKRYTRGLLRPRPTFTLQADFEVDRPGIVGVMGPNG